MGQRLVGTVDFHSGAGSDQGQRIDQIQDEVARIARMLDELCGERAAARHSHTDCAAPEQSPRSTFREPVRFSRSFEPDDRTVERQRAKMVRRLIRQRRLRDRFFPPDIFADPAWDMLLDLYAARLERQPVSVSSLCIAAAVPATTALRWIKTMTDAGLFLREADPHDGRRIFIGLADQAALGMEGYFEALDE